MLIGLFIQITNPLNRYFLTSCISILTVCYLLPNMNDNTPPVRVFFFCDIMRACSKTTFSFTFIALKDVTLGNQILNPGFTHFWGWLCKVSDPGCWNLTLSEVGATGPSLALWQMGTLSSLNPGEALSSVWQTAPFPRSPSFPSVCYHQAVSGRIGL